ncbi:type II secretion system protein [Desulfocurvus vexinensis]|uniref:type II secretion system protein n=1 Tax=Desulfocurvus vexinensis TaxID=399548 RepID=UPI0004B6E1D1|nr:prepilin-type N-terminal cleavage/methylation domain-containing protein [Desulfocurvus vexinensis]
MSDKLLSRRAGQSGFTLMELLVVLVIMGFLLGMIVPRLGSVADSAVDTVCDSNNKGVRYFTKLFLDENGRLPSNLTSLVVYNANASSWESDYTDDLLMSNGDPDDGAEYFAEDFVTRCGVTLHQLSEAEATELRKMGIASVLYLQGENRGMEKVAVAEDVYVAMAGDVTAAAYADATDDIFPEGNPFWFGRILMGVSDQSELVTKGFIQAAALCPGGIQQQDNVTYNNYVIVLPRLEATVAGLNSVFAGQTFYALANDGTGAPASDGEIHEFSISSQEKWEFDFSCPEGHKWPDNDNDTWTIYTTQAAAEAI